MTQDVMFYILPNSSITDYCSAIFVNEVKFDKNVKGWLVQSCYADLKNKELKYENIAVQLLKNSNRATKEQYQDLLKLLQEKNFELNVLN